MGCGRHIQLPSAWGSVQGGRRGGCRRRGGCAASEGRRRRASCCCAHRCLSPPVPSSPSSPALSIVSSPPAPLSPTSLIERVSCRLVTGEQPCAQAVTIRLTRRHTCLTFSLPPRSRPAACEHGRWGDGGQQCGRGHEPAPDQLLQVADDENHTACQQARALGIL